MARTQAQRDYATEMRQEPRLVTCRDGALLVTPNGDRPAEVEDVHPEGVPAALDACRLAGDVSLLRADVRECYEGTALARAHRVAKLTPMNHVGVFGHAYDPTYVCGRLYRKIGLVVTDHCPLHLISREDCAVCAEHRTTCATLKDATVNVLMVACKFTDPVDQRNAVLFVQTARKRLRRKKVNDHDHS